jgi:methylated-DNA-[protein]-cysteine S-methyltransferase
MTSSVHWALFPTSLGDCGVAWRDDVVVATQLPLDTRDAAVRRLITRTGGVLAVPTHIIRHAISSITSLLEGHRTDLTCIACDFSGLEPLAAKVYAVTRAIPAGETRTYGSIAQELGDKRLAQQVGQMLGRNPFPIIVPCHRVLGANGKLVGFSADGGVNTKLRMLQIERARIGQAPTLFDDAPDAWRV